MPRLATRLKGCVPLPARRALRAAARRAMEFPALRSAAFDVRDGVDWLLGRRDPLTPPRKLLHGTGGGLDIGDAYLRHFRELAGLTPHESVLDVGCGVGRMALPLTKYLSTPGRYEGFDVVRANAAWCRDAITPRFPNFRFRHVDVFNRLYNARGKLAGDTYRFPHADASFDFAFLTSVFTHLLPPDAAHYLAELGRVLRPGGRCLATFFLVNPESAALVDAGRGLFRLHPTGGPYRVSDPAAPEFCVALEEPFVAAAARAAGFTHVEPHYGTWCGRPAGADFQDIVVLRKE